MNGSRSATWKDQAGRRYVQFKYKRKIKEAYAEQEIDKNVWVLKATPRCWRRSIKEKTWNSVIWPESISDEQEGRSVCRLFREVPALGGFMAHAMHVGQVFLCPAYLSIQGRRGQGFDGPAPRPLDPSD